MLFHFIQTFLQIRPEFLFHFFCKILCIGFTIFQQIFYIHLTRFRMLTDYFIQMRLSELWVISLIMAVTTIAYQVNENIRVKFLPVACGYLSAFYGSLRIISIYVQHGGLDRCRQ